MIKAHMASRQTNGICIMGWNSTIGKDMNSSTRQTLKYATAYEVAQNNLLEIYEQ
jgi:hypothetical protein